MKQTVLMMSFLGFWGAAALPAEMCTLDVVPAATLLLPYFEVDLNDPEGINTLFTIHNTEPDATVVHLIFWTDYGFPTIAFDVFLTGYDVETFNMKEIFQGYIPITADEANDPDDTISPHGRPEWEDSFNLCQIFFPNFVNPAIQGTALRRLVNGHTGILDPSLGGCIGHDYGDFIARGYLTVDNVSQCSFVLDPAEPGYFANGAGIANNKNQLLGEYFFLDPSADAMAAFPLVHIEADSDFNGAGGVPGATFYGTRLAEPGLAGSSADNREPLGSAWAVRYQNAGTVDRSELIVWRDTTNRDSYSAPVSCGLTPDWSPLELSQAICFDENENVAEVCPGSSCLPFATQRRTADELTIPFPSGWCHLNLNHDCPTCEPGGAGLAGNLAQSYVTAVHSLEGRFAGGLPAIEVAHFCDLSDVIFLQIFTDGFESGDTTQWTQTKP